VLKFTQGKKRMTLNQMRKNKQPSDKQLPPIPDKRYFTIGEVGYLCGVKPHVLRYWEQEFSRLKPVKRRGRRYYQLNDLLMVRQIRKLLYEDGFTIEGARLQLMYNGEEVNKVVHTGVVLKKVLLDLENVLQKLKMEDR